jgi:hypothetical protein
MRSQKPQIAGPLDGHFRNRRYVVSAAFGCSVKASISRCIEAVRVKSKSSAWSFVKRCGQQLEIQSPMPPTG